MSNEVQDRVERGGFLLFLALVTIALLAVTAPFLQPLLWASLGAIMFQPLYRWFLRKRPGHETQAALATLLVILFAILVPALLLGALVIGQAINAVIAIQESGLNLTELFNRMVDSLPQFIQRWLAESGWDNLEILIDRTQTMVQESIGMIAEQAISIGGSIASFALAFGIGLYANFYMLRDGQKISEAILRALPFERSIADQLAHRFVGIVRATIKGSVVVGAAQGVLGAITFWIVGMPSVLLLGVLMSISSLIPAVGTGLIWGPVGVYLLATGSIWQGVVVLASGVGVISMADNILRPILVGRDTGIPDWVVLVTTLGGLSLLGLSGIIVGPLVAGLFIAGWSIFAEKRQQPASA